MKMTLKYKNGQTCRAIAPPADVRYALTGVDVRVVETRDDPPRTGVGTYQPYRVMYPNGHTWFIEENALRPLSSFGSWFREHK